MTSTYLESKSTNLEFEQILNFSVIHQSRNVLSSLFLQFRGIDTKQKVKHLWCAHFSWFHTIFPRFLLKLTKLQNCPGFPGVLSFFKVFQVEIISMARLLWNYTSDTDASLCIALNEFIKLDQES